MITLQKKWVVMFGTNFYQNSFFTHNHADIKKVTSVPATIFGEYYVEETEKEITVFLERAAFDIQNGKAVFNDLAPEVLWTFNKDLGEFGEPQSGYINIENGRLSFNNNSVCPAVLEMLLCVLNHYNQYLGEKIKNSMFNLRGRAETLCPNVYSILSEESLMAADKVFSAMGANYFFSQLDSKDGLELAVGGKKARQVIGLPDKVLEFLKKQLNNAALTKDFKVLCAQDANEGIFVIDYFETLSKIKMFHSSHSDWEQTSFIGYLADLKGQCPQVNIPRLIKYLIKQKAYYGGCQYKAKYESRTSMLDTFSLPLKELKQYLDYLHMMPAAGDLYPRILTVAHNICVRNAKIVQNPELAERFAKTAASLEPLDYEGKDFIMTHPHTVEELVEEGNTLEHCVATYAGTIANGLTRVMFLRQKEAPTVPFVTVEIDGDFNVTQVKGKYDIDVTDPDVLEFVKKWRKEKKA